MNLILASQSPRRRELIQKITDQVEFISTDTDENIDRGDLSPAEFAKELAQAKAVAAFDQLNQEEKEDKTIIGCDTIVTLDDKIYGKPKDAEEALNMLSELSGRAHSVITAVCLIDETGKKKDFFDETLVVFSDLSETDLKAYIDTGDPFDKAGAYGIQNVPEHFIDHIEGDYNNVVGLPVEALAKELEIFKKFI